MPALCPHGQGEDGQPNGDRPGQGGGVPEIPKFVGTPFMDDPLNRKTTGETHLRLWHHLDLILKKVSSSFITNMLSICIFIGLVRFEDKDF